MYLGLLISHPNQPMKLLSNTDLILLSLAKALAFGK